MEAKYKEQICRREERAKKKQVGYMEGDGIQCKRILKYMLALRRLTV